VKNFDAFSLFINLIINAHRRMEQTANVLAPVERYPNVRKRCEDLAVVEKASSKSGRGIDVFRADIVQNLPQIV